MIEQIRAKEGFTTNFGILIIRLFCALCVLCG